MSVTNKDIPENKNLLGQFLTPKEIAEFCLGKTHIASDVIIEPSCGQGIFLDLIRRKVGEEKQILGIELDPELAGKYPGKEKIVRANFYDFRMESTKTVHFIGNPPYRSPAYSLTTHEDYVKELRSIYGVRGIREEAALFLLKTYDLINRAGAKGYIDYILPAAIFKNNSPVFSSFVAFLKSHLCLKQVWTLKKSFPKVSRNLIYVSFETGQQESTFLLDGVETPVDNFYDVAKEIIPFQKIFKKTYLGSVPCEGIFMSCRHESLNHFRMRLRKLFDGKTTLDNLISRLSYQGKPHLLALRNGNQRKIKTIFGYIEEALRIATYKYVFNHGENYVPIRHRDEDRFYFRYAPLKKAKFVYQLNPKPCDSFYFPGNPSNTSKDYFGYCSYDVNRNSGPGANRTVPVTYIDINITEEFLDHWRANAMLPITHLPDYLLHISKSQWYRDMKNKYERFYFGVPKDFDMTWKVSSHLPSTNSTLGYHWYTSHLTS